MVIGMDAHDKFHVEPGEIWAAGPHVFLCGDLETDDIERFIKMIPRPVHMVYTDPPWNAGNAKYWRTHAGMSRDVDINNLWSCICEIIQQLNAEEVFIEQSVRNWHDFEKIAAKHNLPSLTGKWVVFYGSPHKPNILLRFAETERQGFNPSGLHGEAMTDYVFRCVAQPGKIVVDPCVGKGMTARMAHKYGMICYGMELNPKRLAVTLDWLSRYYEVERRECDRA